MRPTTPSSPVPSPPPSAAKRSPSPRPAPTTPPSGTRVDLHSAIASAVANTVEYPPDADLPTAAPGPHATRIEVTRESTLAASRRLLADGHAAAALNFASAVSPGGGFLGGARAREESLARSSALFACLVGRRMYAFA